MSNNIYNILNNFNKVAQEAKPAVTEQKPATQKTKLEESMEQISEKYMGFKKTVAAIKKGGSAENPEAVAAAIGRKKYGKEKFQQAAAAGKKLNEASYREKKFNDFNKWKDAATAQGYKIKKSSKPGTYEYSYDDGRKLLAGWHQKYGGFVYIKKDTPPSTKDWKTTVDNQMVKLAMGMKSYLNMVRRENGPEAVPELMGHVKELTKNFAGNWNNTSDWIIEVTEAKAKAIYNILMGQRGYEEYNWEEAYPGITKYLTPAFKNAYNQVFGNRPVAEAAKPDYIDLDKDGDKKEPMKKAAKDAKQKKVTEMDKSQPSSDRGGESSGDPYAKGGKATPVKAKDVAKSAGKALNKAMDKAHKKPVEEVAPPGAKAERMVKHIKKGYAKDGKLSPKEKSIAYATAWKAHNKGKLDETIKSLIEAGYTKEQIVEGWEEMMKDVQRRGKEEKGTGKFDKKTISTGTVYTRKYDPKSGETDDTGKDGEGQEVKRGRGRPKKSTFESFSTAKKMIADTFRTLVEGRIEGGIWVDKPGPVPAPSGDPEGVPAKPAAVKPAAPVAPVPKTVPPGTVKKEEEDMEEGNAFGAAIAKAKADGVQPGEKVEVGGKEYPVKEDDELNQMRRIAGLQECGMMQGAGYGQDSEGRMNVSTNMSSDGNKSVTITADGDAAVELLQMLKLAGMEGHSHSEEPAALVVTNEPEQEMEEAKDERYHASTTPDEQVAPIQAQLKGGDGDVAGQEKTMRKHGYQFGDNNLAMREVATEGIENLDTMGTRLMKEYESIKVKK